MNYESLLKSAPYSLTKKEKDKILLPALFECFNHHYNNCLEYQKFCDKKNYHPTFDDFKYEDIPFLPVEIFKQIDMRSAREENIVRVLNSSATSSQTPSKIYIDNITRSRQMKTLTWILKAFLGNERKPFMILDADPSIRNQNINSITARSAAIRGFLTASNSVHYFMEDSEAKLQLNIEKLLKYLKSTERVGDNPVIFGFTYILYSNVIKELKKNNISFSLENAKIIHIGGWKKLKDKSVSKDVFNAEVSKFFGVKKHNIIDVYGFTEQLGIIYPDIPEGRKICPNVSEIIIRDPNTLKPLPDGEKGLVEFISPLPYSYPGHAILLDDIGRIISRERTPCGLHGTSFEILGRATKAELRGCGDILAEAELQKNEI